jgi:hypothetical protein
MVCIVLQESLLKEYINLKYKQTTECIDEIYNIVTNGLKAGGIEPTEIKIYAVMQQRSIEDFDGHAREIFNMNTSQFSSKPPANKIQLTAKKGFLLWGCNGIMLGFYLSLGYSLVNMNEISIISNSSIN